MTTSRATFAVLAIVALSAFEPRVQAQLVTPNTDAAASRTGDAATGGPLGECASVAAYFDEMARSIELTFARLEKDVRDQLARTTGRRAAVLNRELDDLRLEKAKLLADLANTRAKSLEACGKAAAQERARRAGVHRAVATLCGAPPAASSVVVLVGGASSKNAIAVLGPNVPVARTSGAALVAAGVGQALSHLRTARGGAAVLVVDDAEPVLREVTPRDARLAWVAAGHALALDPGVVVLRTPAPLTANDRALAASRGWRVAGDAPNAIRAAACAR